MPSSEGAVQISDLGSGAEGIWRQSLAKSSASMTTMALYATDLGPAGWYFGSMPIDRTIRVPSEPTGLP